MIPLWTRSLSSIKEQIRSECTSYPLYYQPWSHSQSSVPLVTDLEVDLIGLDTGLFPDLPGNIRVHQGFSQEQSK